MVASAQSCAQADLHKKPRNPLSSNLKHIVMYQESVRRIISGNEQLAAFWSNSHGWAIDEAADLMSKSRLDWQVELSKTLMLWETSSISGDGQLILAWANLGALIEGTLKLFLAVYYEYYKEDIDSIKNKGKLVDPDGLALEKLKLFFKKKQLIDKKWLPFIDLVQSRRNAIHAFRDRDIGTLDDFKSSVTDYLEFLLAISRMLPYPDDIYEPVF